jgi:L-threonylcarbamoyladenylate synthase
MHTSRLSAGIPESIAQCAEILLRGGLVAMPTETVYGLAANALNATAVERIFRAKERPYWDPLIVHVSDEVMLMQVVTEVPGSAQKLMDVFWPGPLTMLLPRKKSLPDAVPAGRELAGVRMPAHPIALALLRAADVPLAAPSANRFGGISPTTAEHVLADLDGRIDAVLDAGPAVIGVESTVLDPVARVLYRQGGVSQTEIEDVLGESVTIYDRPAEASQTAAAPESLPSPGVGIRHYAPRARLLLVQTENEMRSVLKNVSASVGVMLPQNWRIPDWQGVIFRWAHSHDAREQARTLYSGLRSLDAAGVATIICPLPAASGEPLVEAIRDRLLKAAREA